MIYFIVDVDKTMGYIRLKDIAEKAHVSINTVSRALKGKNDIGKETTELVRKIADELGYIPHANASSLRSNKNRTIGVVITNIDNTFFGRILQGINDALVEYDYTILTLTSNEDIEKEKKILKILLSNRVAGIIIIPSRDIGRKLEYENLQVPHINIIRKGAASQEKTYFTVDSYQSGFLVAQHFATIGKKHPAYIGYNLPVSCNRLRLDGYKQGLKDNDIILQNDHIFSCMATPQDAYNTTRLLINSNKKIDSLFVYNDQMAFGTIKAFLDMKIRIPEDITIVGHDDIAEASFFTPALSTIRIPKYRLGFESAISLIDMIQNKESNEKSVIYRPKLIIRET